MATCTNGGGSLHQFTQNGFSGNCMYGMSPGYLAYALTSKQTVEWSGDAPAEIRTRDVQPMLSLLPLSQTGAIRANHANL